MNTKTKTVGLLIGTLVVGMVLGAFLHSLFIRHTVKRMSHKWRKPDIFIDGCFGWISLCNDQLGGFVSGFDKVFNGIIINNAEFNPCSPKPD